MKEFLTEVIAADQMRRCGQLLLAADKLERLLVKQSAVSPRELCAAYNLLGGCSAELGRVKRAAEAYRQASEYAVEVDFKREFYSNYLFFRHYRGDLQRNLQGDLWNYQQLFSGRKLFRHDKAQHQRRKIRLGYLSTDFYSHIVVNFSIQLFACYDHDRYEVFLYGRQTIEDRTTQQLQGMVDHWQNIGGLSYEAAAEKIYDDRIDILVDLSGHTNKGETLIICSYKPAPVQVCGIGWFNTTGLRAMDYFLTDIYCSPPGQGDGAFMERLIRLPHTQFCYTPSEAVQEARWHYHVHERITFGSFNNFAKITDDMLVLWLSILNRVPGSRLLLKNSHQGAVHQQHALQIRAKHLGYQFGQIELRMATDGPLDEYQEVDIALDPYPYPGGGTTCDALYYGVPVITLAGRQHHARFGVSILQNVGLGNLVAESLAEYEELAVALAGEKNLLEKLHERLRQQMKQSPLMDAQSYVRDMEMAYEEIWSAWQRKSVAGKC